MAISSAAEVYTVLQRHLDTLLIIFIMCLKRQCVGSGRKSDSELLIDQEKNLSCQEEAYPR